jgi:hypothetical protein
MANHVRNTILTFAGAAEIQRYKPASGANGVIVTVHDDNPAVTFEVATCFNNQTFTGSGSGITSIPTTAEFNDRERGNGALFSASNPFDSNYGGFTDILIRISGAGKLIVEDVA